MGFKDIEKFNDALLAKQVWRMMNNQDSLCYRVFKAKFFPDCSILEAQDSTQGSYAWKSILGARDVIKRGSVWRIGNGQSVVVREDKWLPDKCCRTFFSPPPSLPPDLKVSALINAETASWNVNQIQTYFLPNDARLIMSIPLSPRLPPDRLIWSLTASGVFSARSAYHMLANNALANNAGSSNPNPQKSFWRGLWQLRVPNKVKHLAWRACNDGLPMMVSLLRRHVVQSALCNIYHTQKEDPCTLYGAVPSWSVCGGIVPRSVQWPFLHRLILLTYWLDFCRLRWMTELNCLYA